MHIIKFGIEYRMVYLYQTEVGKSIPNSYTITLCIVTLQYHQRVLVNLAFFQ
jgi:hypothetical protein